MPKEDSSDPIESIRLYCVLGLVAMMFMVLAPILIPLYLIGRMAEFVLEKLGVWK